MTQCYSDNFNDNTLSGIWDPWGYGLSHSAVEEDQELKLEMTVSGTTGSESSYQEITQSNIDDYLDVRVKIVSSTGDALGIDGGLAFYNNDNDVWYSIECITTTISGYANSIEADGNYFYASVELPAYPFWVRMTYGGQVFKYYYSTDNNNWDLIYYENYDSSPDIDVVLSAVVFNFYNPSSVSGVLTLDDFISVPMEADPLLGLYGLQVYDAGDLKFDLNYNLKYIIYETTVSGGESGTINIPVTNQSSRRYTCLSFSNEVGTTEHEAYITISGSSIILHYNSKSVGGNLFSTFRGMPSGDSIIYVMGY